MSPIPFAAIVLFAVISMLLSVCAILVCLSNEDENTQKQQQTSSSKCFYIYVVHWYEY